ncbi:MAG TPA: glycosyltransferase family 2 protein, partial [Chthonomonadaceae bacterium]|nr:glycosyltransferase family 2 protein [Chthonomonadaceae bacterium]
MISILVPAYNEAARIGETVDALRQLDLGDDTEIIVIDDGSTDGTSAVADDAGATVVLRQPNGGKGAALRAGLAIASGEILLLIDADLGATASEAARLARPVLAGTADMT